ncbi:glycoside hydrolase family 2 protein [Pseudomaricurvus sp. HS19]|uniref:glycoside hydrolase family 2 protein n=1 Tax=Pseudomaricurvus sp. HS19 TaxID=2692626 RepID=UPI00136D6738|nr:glycoside hydrolase family 2 TIM barrel-domain containing protein [Pseudomaricurvus sp. HS19]MYM64277.1 hypothetical protein [Pseudomaricurvus sp. HS19]
MNNKYWSARSGWQLLLVALLLPFFSVVQAAEKKDEHEAAMDFFKGEPDQGYPDISPLLVNAQGRDYQSLNGMWNIMIDEAGMGWRVITKHDYYDTGEIYPKTGMELLEHSFDDRKQLRVPGDWNSQAPELDRYRSRILYQKSVDLKPKAGQRYFVHFGASNYTTDLFVNDKLVGRHIGGYTSFNFDVTDFVQKGSNNIIVRVDANLDETTIPTMRTSDFWKYGGLIGDVGLVTVPDTFISQYHVYLSDREKNEISGWVQLAGGKVAGQKVELKIGKARVKTSAVTDAKGRANFKVQAQKLDLWSPENPYLYDVSLAQGKERIKDRIGFRTIAVDGLNILLNGEPIKLYGISMHAETPLHPGMASTHEDVLASLKLVKELNTNYIRLAHYPHSEYTLKLADEMGLMVWSEVPIVSLIDWENADTLAVAKSQVAENVTRDMNRASIILWSVSNESFPQTQARLDFLTTLVETARSLDDSKRPITSALVGGQGEEFAELGKAIFAGILRHPKLAEADRQRLMAMAAKMAGGKAPAQPSQSEGEQVIEVAVTDALGKVVDVAGYNQYFGWYYAKFFSQMTQVDQGIVRDVIIDNIMPRVRFTNPYGKPMIISEFGAGAKKGLRSEEGLMWSEEYQARVFRAQLDMLPRSEFVQGMSPWVLKDFRSHLRELNGIQDTYNRKGLVSETGEKKLAFDVLADFYRQQQDKSAD